MRSVPYAVVCLLGMDEGAFPRSTEGLGFDLIRRQRRIGDRNPRDEDRFLLLEALLAARRHFVVLHSGRDPHSNEARPPCVPVGELRDLVDQTLVVPMAETRPSTCLTTEHQLQAFSPRAFSATFRNPVDPSRPRPWSFDRRLMAGAEARCHERAARPGLWGLWAGGSPSKELWETRLRVFHGSGRIHGPPVVGAERRGS